MTSPRPLHVGLTGNIASGKSAVAAQFAELGATIIDADVLARQAIAPGTPGFVEVVEQFGKSVLAADGSIDRAALRQRVFNDPEARERLNAIVHPEVGRLRDAAFAAAVARGDRMVISDIPLLFEVGLEALFDAIVLVDAPPAIRRERLITDRQLSPAEADAMIAAQWPSEQKRDRATWVIDNGGSRAQLQARVFEVWHQLLLQATQFADRRHSSAPTS